MVRWLHSQDLRDFPFLLVLVIEVGAIGYALAEPQHWLRAVGAMTVGLGLAGLLRLLLTNDQAGLLRVRRRTFDVACYWGFGAAAIILSITLPQR